MTIEVYVYDIYFCCTFYCNYYFLRKSYNYNRKGNLEIVANTFGQP